MVNPIVKSGLAVAVGVAVIGCKDPAHQAKSSPKVKSAQVAPGPKLPVDSNVSLRVRKQVADILGKKPDTIKETDLFMKDLGADSLDAVEIVMAVEDEFGIEIADEDAAKINSVADLIHYVKGKTNK